MLNVICVSRFAPDPIGHGGHHRAYQVVNDLQAAVGQANVWVYEPQLILTQPAAPRQPGGPLGLRQRLALLLRFLRYKGNPYRFLSYILSNTFAGRSTFGRYSGEHYERFLKQVPQPAVGFVDHPAQSGFIEINRRHGLPTVACPQNLETLDLSDLDPEQEWSRYAFIADVVAELKILAACDERLFISRVEAGLAGGLGLANRYYPYLPVGAIRERLMRQRRLREGRPPDSRLYLLLGSAAHASTREGLSWFIRNATAAGLPPGVRVHVAGLETERLLPPGASVPGLELDGWLEQDALDELLGRARAVLVPQRRGFGALTRLPELACAGIPAYVSAHATHALDLPPGLAAIEDDWPAWQRCLECAAQQAEPPSVADYEHWEARKPRPIPAVLHRYQ